MASPAVVGTPAETAVVTASTTHTVNLPAGASGNLMLAVMSKGSAGTTPTVNALTGWSELLDEAQTLGLYIAYHVCDGTEGATLDFTLSSATRGAWIVYEISGYIAPGTQAPQIGSTATGSSTTPDPPSVAVTGGSKDILAIAFFGRAGEEADDDTWVTATPTSYTNLLQKACSTSGVNLAGMVASAQRQVTTATENPTTFTCATGAWRAQTVVIHPAPPPTTTGVAKISLASGNTPDTRTAHSIKIRARTTSGAGTIRAALYEGANNRSTDLESSALTTSLADYTLSIADGNAANITSYSNLDVWLWGYAAGGGSIVFEVDQVWLEIPAGSGAAGDTPTPGGATAGGASPTAKVSETIAGATAAGPAPIAKVAVALGGANAQGLSGTTRASSTIGGAAAAGPVQPARVPVPQGAATAGGVAPSESTSTSETPTPGGAVAGGAAPIAKASLAAGGATTGGPATTAKASLTIGGAVAAGVGPSAGPTSETPVPGGATAGGFAPIAHVATGREVVAQGGLGFLWVHGITNASGPDQAARASLTIGGATAGGTAPTETSPTQTGTAKISLASGSAPGTRTAHSIKLRARTTSGAGKIRVALYEGATNRTGGVGYLESNALTTSLADYTLALSDAAAASIGSYSNLDIWVWGFAAGGGAIVFELDQLWLEMPASGAGSETPPPGGAITGGASPAARASSSAGGAIGAGTTATVRVSLPQGSALAGGHAPGESVSGSDTPVPGGAAAGGFAPTVRIAQTIGGAVAVGFVPSARTSSTISGAVSAGLAPAARVSLTIGGALAGGRTPAEPTGVFETPTPGGAVTGGPSPTVKIVVARGGAVAQGTAPLAYAYQIPVPGGATATGRAPTGVRVTLTIDGAIAGGFPAGVPLLLTQGVRIGFLGRSGGGFVPSGRNGKIDEVELTPR